MRDFDVLIVGSGLAGLTAALHLAPTHRVALITKGQLHEGASGWAQGGIAAVLDADDSLEAHTQDTLVAGAGLCNSAATRFVVEHAPACIAWLRALGVPFSMAGQQLHLTREGGHSARRIAHVADATGAAVQCSLIEQVRQSPRITVFEHHMLVDLIISEALATASRRCAGLQALDLSSGQVVTWQAPWTLLATGGAGQVYLHTTNPDTATGDGIAAAWRAGCPVANMEFIQFHPTCLYHPQVKNFLISEAMRGEGGRLLLPDGTRFMPSHDTRAELAPRDVVARAIDAEMKRHGLACVYLDISHRGEAFIRAHFPTIRARCLTLGIDITREPIPVVPAAHYTCGGVPTDLAGRTDLPGLYALGEVACTGLHGANRLASNSLVECMVLARAAAQDLIAQVWPEKASVTQPAPTVTPPVTDADEASVIAHNRDELRRLMGDYVGIVRTRKRLERAAHRIAVLQKEISTYFGAMAPTRELLELRNLVQTADLIVRSARQRRESRGLHFCLDYPQTLPTARPTVLRVRPRRSAAPGTRRAARP